MKKSPNTSDSRILRQKAEGLLDKKQKSSASLLSEADTLKLIHELEVHQIELELQNEELRQAQANEKLITEKYVALYTFAPTGYYTLSTDGNIIELNLSGANLLGKERNYLKNKRFSLYITGDSKPVFNEFFEKVFTSDSKVVCEVTLSASNESPVYAHLSGVAAENKEQCLLTVVDITKRKQAEDALIESRDLIYSIIENVPIRVFWKDLELRYLGCNNAFAHDAGMSGQEDLVGKDDFQMGWNEQAELYRTDDQHVIDSGKPKIGYEEPQTTPDGNSIWLRTSKVPLYDANRKVMGMLGIYDDITQSKQNEIKILESEKRLKTILDTSPFPTAVVDTNDEKIRYWSKSAIKLFGHHPKTSMEWYELAYPDPDYRQEVIERWKPFLETAQDSVIAVNTGEYRITCKNGSVKICELFAQFIPDNLIVTMNDVTEMKHAEKALRESETRFKALHDASFGGIAIHDKGLILDCNQGLSEITGYTVNELIGMDGLLLIAEEYREIVTRNVQAEYEKPYEAIGIKKNGEKYPLRLAAKMIPYKEQVSRVVEFRDITEQKKSEEAIIKLNDELEQKVIERTENLESKNTELARMNKLFVGRELRMVELKQMIKELEGNLTNK
jgi:PAS domain S-box-containing protein